MSAVDLESARDVQLNDGASLEGIGGICTEFAEGCFIKMHE